MAREPRWGLRRESGTAMIEAALVIPAMLIIAFGVVMAGRVAHAQVGVQAVAREAGRTLATAAAPGDGLDLARARAAAVADGYGLSTDLLSVELQPRSFRRGATVRAEASYRVHLGDLPLLGELEVTVSATHDERVELYRSRRVAVP